MDVVMVRVILAAARVRAEEDESNVLIGRGSAYPREAEPSETDTC